MAYLLYNSYEISTIHMHSLGYQTVYCRQIVCGDLSFTVFLFAFCLFVGHAAEINKLLQQISHTQVVRTGKKLANRQSGPSCISDFKISELWPYGSPTGHLRCQNSQICVKKFL